MSGEIRINTEKLLQTSRIGLWCVEAEEGKEPRFYADAVMDELLGVTGDPTPEERFRFHRAHVHPDDMPLFEEYSDRLTEVRTEIVYRYIHPVSGEMFVRCGGMRDKSVEGYISLIGTHQDISDTLRLEKEKQAERRLAEINNTLRQEKVRSEDYYKEILEMENCGVMAYTLPGHRILHMNAQALRMYSLKSVQEAQRDLGNILKKVAYPKSETIEKLKNLRNEEDTVDYECIINKGTPNECHALAKSKVVVIPSGERAVITTFLDVSDMVTLKNALRQAEEGSRAKSSFLFAMSHDLRTPMNAIIGYTDLIEKHWGEKELTENYLCKLKEAGKFLMELIGNVLEVARIESGKETLNETPWDLRKLDETLNVILSNEITGKELTIIRKINVEHTKVYCDVLKVREILMNLLSNAIKYTPEGGTVTLDIEELPSEVEGCITHKIIVEDTGIGIGEEYIPHLFEAFTREKSSSENGIMGTGLGLRIVKSFVDLMGGTISVESRLGKGTRFTLLISHRLVPEEEIKEIEKGQEMPEEILPELRILLAEDNALNAEIAETILEDAGVDVEVAENGERAVAMVKKVPADYYNLVLMDIQMPKVNGYEAARQIRALPDERAEIPIIAMTANAFDEDQQAAYQAGMNGYVTKPVDVQKLIHEIREVTEEKK